MVDKKLSDIALSDDDVEEIEDVVSPIVIASIPLWRGSDVVPVEGATPVKYPPNPADQLHGLSVAEMVRNGQGQLLDDAC